MRLFEAIIDANHRAVAGDKEAGVHPADFENELPVVALTCIDPRLNALFPNVLALPGEQFIWLRNAGNIVTSPVSSTMRSLALACAIKGGKEIAIIGHTDCLVGKTSTMQLLERLHAVGVERHLLPDNINEYFGIFSSERQNVIRAAETVRQSPLIGPKIPVHGLVVDITTGKLEWLVNGYDSLGTLSSRWQAVSQSATQTAAALGSLAEFKIGEMKFPENKIGEVLKEGAHWLTDKFAEAHPAPPPAAAPAVPKPAPPKIPLPPPLRPRIHLGKRRPE